MKNILMSFLVLGLSLFFGYQFIQSPGTAEASPDFLDWMFENGLTKYNDIEAYRPFDLITRGEAAKFVDAFAKSQTLEKTYTECDFNDISNYDATLVPHIKQACFYGLMKGSNGQYRPTGNITEAEAITIVMRSIYGFFAETADPWYIAYYNRGKEHNLITNEDIHEMATTFISREKLGIWFYQASQLNTDGGFYSEKPNQAQYIQYSEEAFDKAIKENKQVALFFHAKRCPICHGTRKVITDNITELPKDVRIFEVDIEIYEDLREKYEVRTQTTFVFFDRQGNHKETNNKIYPLVIENLLEKFE